MQGERKLYRHALAVHCRHIYAAASQPVGHHRTGVDVVGIIVLSLSSAIHAIGCSSPLGVVSCSFQAARQSAYGSATFDVAHTASESYGIGGYDTSAGGVIGADHTVELIASLVELEGAEIYPCAATHTLVDGKFRSLSLVIDDVFGIGYTLGQCLVAYVNGIFSLFLEVRLIAYQAVLLSLGSLRLSHGTHLERIFSILIGSLEVGESQGVAVLPFLAIHEFLVGDGVSVVVIHHNLLLLPVAFTGSEDDGAGIFQHRDEIRHHNGLGKEVFRGTEEVRTLPFPSSFSIPVSSVRCP